MRNLRADRQFWLSNICVMRWIGAMIPFWSTWAGREKRRGNFWKSGRSSMRILTGPERRKRRGDARKTHSEIWGWCRIHSDTKTERRRKNSVLPYAAAAEWRLRRNGASISTHFHAEWETASEPKCKEAPVFKELLFLWRAFRIRHSSFRIQLSCRSKPERSVRRPRPRDSSPLCSGGAGQA